MAKEEKTTSGLSSDYIFHPGITLEEVLNDRKMSQKDLAIATGVSPKHISEIISGKKDISISFAKKLEYVLSIEAQFWLNLQSNYDREIFEYSEVNSISKEELNILQKLEKSHIINAYVKLGLIDNKESKQAQVLKLRSILGVSNLCNISKQAYAAAYRIKDNVDPYVLCAWQKLCEYKNKDVQLNNELNTEKLKESINKIKKTMFLEQDKMQKELKKLLAECGIVFDVVDNYQGAPVQGYLKHVNNNNLLLCLTNRGKYLDIFWFTLFHEIAHIINGDIKNHYVDFSNIDNRKEDKANIFARDTLINHKDYLKFIETNYKDINEINKFAKKCKVDSSIVIGRLQNDSLLDYAELSKYRKNIIKDNLSHQAIITH